MQKPLIYLALQHIALAVIALLLPSELLSACIISIYGVSVVKYYIEKGVTDNLVLFTLFFGCIVMFIDGIEKKVILIYVFIMLLQYLIIKMKKYRSR